jgi:hypothetical protein
MNQPRINTDKRLPRKHETRENTKENLGFIFRDFVDFRVFVVKDCIE